MHIAVEFGYREIVQALLAAGANLEAQSVSGRTPLHEAVQSGHREIVQVLINAGVNLEAQDGTGSTPLHEAARGGYRETVQILINAHANLEAQDTVRRTPLHYAAIDNHQEIVQLLIDAYANIEAQDIFQATPLHHAAYFAAYTNEYEQVKTLVQAGANSKVLDNQGRTPGDFTDNRTIRVYLNSLPVLSTQLHAAIQESNCEAVQNLITQGAQVIMKDEHGNTSLHNAIGAYNRENPTELDTIARILIHAARRSVNSTNAAGQTPLHIAVREGNLRMAEYLIRHGANINVQDNAGDTPLHHPYSLAMRDKLLRHGADFSIVNHAGETPISSSINLWVQAGFSAPNS